jgi:hypothetical protein
VPGIPQFLYFILLTKGGKYGIIVKVYYKNYGEKYGKASYRV